MAFSGKKQIVSDPTYKQIITINIIDSSFDDLSRVLVSASNNNREMKSIINKINEAVTEAKRWVLFN